MHRTVFTMIVTLSTYLLSLRLSGVLEVDASVGRGCSTMSGLILSVAFVGFESSDAEQTYPRLWFLPVWHGGIPDSLLLLVVLFVPVEPPLVVVFPRVCGSGCRVVSLFSLCFMPLSFWIYFLGPLKSAWSWLCGGQHCWGRVIPGGLWLAMLWRISFVSCSFFCCSWPLGHREA